MKIICIGRNYADHAKELGNEIPDEPVIFMKPKSALLQVHTPFYYPEFTNELHYEAELVLRVSKNGKYIQEKQEKSVSDIVTQSWVAGYVSGYNSWVPDTYDILGNSDIESAMLWLENYCKANPLKNLGDGMVMLIKELRPKRHRTSKESGK